MNNETQNASANFPQGIIPPQILKFYDFLTGEKPEGFLDYETIKEGKHYLSGLINENVLNEFIVFYVDDAHACYSIWINGASDDLEQLPVMYNDTEGTYIICALNFNDFISVFSHNMTGSLAIAWNDYLQDIKKGKNSDSPFEIYSEKKLARSDERNKNNYPDYELFKTYITDVMGIENDTNPVRIMADAIEKYPDMVTYIRNKNGFVIDPGS